MFKNSIPLVYLTASSLTTSQSILTLSDGSSSDMSWGRDFDSKVSYFFGSDSIAPGKDAEAVLGTGAWPVQHLRFTQDCRPLDVAGNDGTASSIFKAAGSRGMYVNALLRMHGDTTGFPSYYPIAQVLDGTDVILAVGIDRTQDAMACSAFEVPTLYSDNGLSSVTSHWILVECHMRSSGNTVMMVDGDVQSASGTSALAVRDIPMQRGTIVIGGSVPEPVDIAGIAIHDQRLPEAERMIIR
jgi:hypothetical protein